MTRKAESIVLGPGEGDLIPVRNTQFIYKAAGEHTDESYEIFEYTEPAGGKGPDPHIHKIQNEAFFVLEGEMEFTMGEHSVKASKGSFVLVPKGIPHSFSNLGKDPAKFLGIVSPPGLREMFRERAAEETNTGGELSKDIRIQIGRKYDQHPIVD